MSTVRAPSVHHVVAWIALAALAVLSLLLSRFHVGSPLIALGLALAVASGAVATLLLLRGGDGSLSVLVAYGVLFFFAILTGLVAVGVATGR